MIPKPLPLDFVTDKTVLDWQDIEYGHSKGWLGWKDVVRLATQAIDSGTSARDILDLASLDKETISDIPDLLRAISSRLSSKTSDPARKWFFLCLAWLYEHESQYPDPLAEVEEIAATFGFPKESYEMLKFMPAQEGYQPLTHTREENSLRLRERWRSFVEEQTPVYRNSRT